MQSFLVDQPHWGSKALECINKNEGFEMITGGEIASSIIKKIKDTINRMQLMDLFKSLSKFIPLVGNIPMEAVQVVPILASIGALGGMAGLMGVTASYAHAHGMVLGIEIKPGNLLDPKDDLLIIRLYPASK